MPITKLDLSSIEDARFEEWRHLEVEIQYDSSGSGPVEIFYYGDEGDIVWLQNELRHLTPSRGHNFNPEKDWPGNIQIAFNQFFSLEDPIDGAFPPSPGGDVAD